MATICRTSDGDLLDSVRLYTPNNTNTSRYGVTASLIWEIDEASRLRVAYTGEQCWHPSPGGTAIAAPPIEMSIVVASIT